MMCVRSSSAVQKYLEEQKYLEQVSTLDLVAVLGCGELLHVLAVLVGDHHGGQLGHGGVESSIVSKTSNITGNSLQALLGFDNGLKLRPQVSILR